MSQTQESPEVLGGPVREARNWSADSKGSIHDDATAGKLGFRGGTVAGSIHMDQFSPVLVEAFGKRWFEEGGLSLGFINATTDREPVRVFVEKPAPGATQVRVWMNRADADAPVAAGTASLSDHSKSELRTRDLRPGDPRDLRILREIQPGFSLGNHELALGSDVQRERLEGDLISGALDWYSGPSPWGGPIATLSTAVELLWRAPSESLGGHMGQSVGLFGAIEVAHVNGPILLDRTYRVKGSVVSVGQSPKTEVLWFDSKADDESGRCVASMRMMLRFMKASSPLYGEA